MKYAFIMGSNLFVVPGNTISFTDNEGDHRFLRIVSFQHHTQPEQKRAVLIIDADIKDNEGHVIKLTGNKAEEAPPYDILEQTDRVLVTKADGTTVLDVHQLDERSAMALEHNISAELEVNIPYVAIRLRGNFVLGNLHIEIDNEKLFIGDDSYGNSVLAGENDLKFSDAGVLI
ncbi:MAG: hypothetical protein ACHQHN_00690 [Sphingobacteriales bacterium]